MADSHPYISGPGNIAQMIDNLRKSFPSIVNADTVKKYGLASNNESYVINALQFIGIIDEDGKKTQEGVSIFSNHNDDAFSKSFSQLIESSYASLFDLYQDVAWELDSDSLITFFRQNDQTSEAIGKRQAKTFVMFAGISGRRDAVSKKDNTKSTPKPKKPKTVVKNKIRDQQLKANTNKANKDIGLTVRVEINLPSNGTKETYDNIFKSINENLIHG